MGPPYTCFSRETTRLMSFPEGERYLRHQQSLVVSLLLSLVSSLLFYRTGGILSHLNSLTHRFLRFPPRNLCFYVLLAVFSLIFAATDTSLLLSSYLSRIGRIENPSCSACGTRPRTPLISFCTAQPRTLCFARSMAIFCLCTTSGPSPEEFPSFWGFMVFRRQPVPRKGSGNNNNNSKSEITDALLRNKGS